MTFSASLKSELQNRTDSARHCRIAELAGMLMFTGKYTDGVLCVSTENEGAAEKISLLLVRLFKTEAEYSEKKGARGRTYYQLRVDDPESCMAAIKSEPESMPALVPSPIVFHMNCCRQAFLRGAFICSGTISDPDKSYHCEFTCKSEKQAGLIMKAAEGLGTPLRYIRRGRYHVVYEKESEAISVLMGNLGARVSLLELENRRIIREMRGNVNRQVNCETANINKTAEASARQFEDIEYIIRTKGPDYLSPSLREIARVRTENPDAPLKDLGDLLDPPVGKSGVNHRLRKISQIAQGLRDENPS